MTSFYLQTLPAQTAVVLQEFQTLKPLFLNSFYLSGGTALSLLLGHRESEDLDFFNQHTFNPSDVEQELISFGQLTETELGKDTLNTFVNGVKLQFLGYPYPLLEPLIEYESVKLSSIKDIACTKLQTVGMRGSKKDFVDLFFILQLFSLKELLDYVGQKYTLQDYSQTHILKSLVYFEDADNQPMPRMHTTADWENIKKHMISVVKNIEF